MMPMIEHPSPNFGHRAPGTVIDMLVIHYTGMQSTEISLANMCDPDVEVSAHYLIDEGGAVHRLVAEENRAWHAGVSSWHGETDTNSRSIGVELQNPGHDWGYVPFQKAQMDVLEELAAGILSRHAISPRMVLAHSDVAPGRKQDPGHLFDWRGLAQAGIGYWPEACPSAPPDDKAAIRDTLNRIGYDPTASLKDVIEASQRHYRPARVDGVLDAECWGIIEALAQDG